MFQLQISALFQLILSSDEAFKYVYVNLYVINSQTWLLCTPSLVLKLRLVYNV